MPCNSHLYSLNLFSLILNYGLTIVIKYLIQSKNQQFFFNYYYYLKIFYFPKVPVKTSSS